MVGFEERKHLTFEQAEGVAPLPRQLRPKEISPELRALLWQVVHRHFEEFQDYLEGGLQFSEPWESIFYAMHVHRHNRMIDEFENDYNHLVRQTKEVFQKGDYVAIFGWLQWVLRRRDVPRSFSKYINAALEAARAAYRVVDDDTIVPVGSDAERETLERAFVDLAATEFHGTRVHLRKAAEEATAGHYADSVRESIHAVESVVRVLEPDGEFSRALTKLEMKTAIHGAMKSGFKSLYGFTSDENGIRHPLLEKATAGVDEADALFMIGACAAFVSYLISKARTAGLLDGDNADPGLTAA
jgi:hypothetical protein